jgi:hypothetical protein
LLAPSVVSAGRRREAKIFMYRNGKKINTPNRDVEQPLRSSRYVGSQMWIDSGQALFLVEDPVKTAVL